MTHLGVGSLAVSYAAEVYKVLIASPSDVAEERNVVREVVHEWNAIRSEHERIVLMPVCCDKFG